MGRLDDRELIGRGAVLVFRCTNCSKEFPEPDWIEVTVHETATPPWRLLWPILIKWYARPTSSIQPTAASVPATVITQSEKVPICPYCRSIKIEEVKENKNFKSSQ